MTGEGSADRVRTLGDAAGGGLGWAGNREGP